jgi:hypothetical protein
MGGRLPDFAGRSGHPSIAALPMVDHSAFIYLKDRNGEYLGPARRLNE